MEMARSKSSFSIDFLSIPVALLAVGLVALNGAWIIEKRLVARTGKRRWLGIRIGLIGLVAAMVTPAVFSVILAVFYS